MVIFSVFLSKVAIFSQIQLFLNVDNKKCLKSATSRKPIENKPCILRKGVENNVKQSFIACLADLYVEFEDSKDKLIPTIFEMKQIIVDSLTINKFIGYQNASLISIFTDKTQIVTTDEYRQERIFQNMKESSNKL